MSRGSRYDVLHVQNAQHAVASTVENQTYETRQENKHFEYLDVS